MLMFRAITRSHKFLNKSLLGRRKQILFRFFYYEIRTLRNSQELIGPFKSKKYLTPRSRMSVLFFGPKNSLAANQSNRKLLRFVALNSGGGGGTFFVLSFPFRCKVIVFF